MRFRPRLFLLCCLLLAGCGSPTPTARSQRFRLPTRLPTVVPTPTPFSLRAEDYWQQGLSRQRSGDAEQALHCFESALRLDPTFAAAHVSRGSLRLAEGKFTSALKDADSALELEPSADAFLLRAEALFRLGEYGASLQAFEQAHSREPTLREDTFMVRWRAAQRLEDTELLGKLAREYESENPNGPLTAYFDSYAALEAGESRQVVARLASDLLDRSDQIALLWYVLGLAYGKLEAWTHAVTALETARDLVASGDDSLTVHTQAPVAELFASLGQAYLGAGRCSDAETMLAFAIESGAPGAEYAPLLEAARGCERSSELESP